MGFTSSPTIHLPLSLHFTQQSQKGKKDETREPSPGAISQNAPPLLPSSALEKPHKLQRRAGSLRPRNHERNPPPPAAMAGVGSSGGGGGGDTEMGGWTGLLHSSTKLLEQAAPTPHFPPLQVRAPTMCSVSSRAASSPSLAADAGYTCLPPPLTGSFPARAEEPGPARGALHQAQGQDHPRRGAVSVAFRHQVDRSLEPT